MKNAAHIYEHPPTRRETYKHSTHSTTLAHIHTHTCAYTEAHRLCSSNSLSFTHKHIHTHTRMHVQKNTYVEAHTHVRTHTHTHTDTYREIYSKIKKHERAYLNRGKYWNIPLQTHPHRNANM